LHFPKVYSIGSYRAIHFDQIDSTNEYAWNLIANNNPTDDLVIIADHQTAGKGQYGRKWEDQAGENIIMTVIKSPQNLPLQNAFLLNVITSLSIIDALEEVSHEKFSIKWPNDVYYGNKKISGILIKNKVQDNVITHTILGTGININQKKFSAEAKNPISLTQITHENHDLLSVSSKILKGYDTYFQMLERNAGSVLFDRYNKKLFGRNEWRYFKVNDEKHEFKICHVTEQGTLCLETLKGERVEYSSGLEYLI